MVYLLKCVISATFDDLAVKLEEKPGHTSSLVDALSKDRPKYASTLELVERVKLITCAVLKSNKTFLIGTYGPDLLNLTLFCMLIKNTRLHQKRLLLDQAFQIVKEFDSTDLEKYVEMGAWEKISQNRVLKRTLEAITKEEFSVQSMSLLEILLIDLRGQISKIDNRASAFTTDSADIETDEKTKEALSSFKKTITDKLANSNLQSRLLNDFLQGLKEGGKIKREFSVITNDA